MEARACSVFHGRALGCPKPPLRLRSTLQPPRPGNPLCCRREVPSRTLSLGEPGCLLLGELLRNSCGARLPLPCLAASRWCPRSTEKLAALNSAVDLLADVSAPSSNSSVHPAPNKESAFPERCYAMAAPGRPPRASSPLTPSCHSAHPGSKGPPGQGSGCSPCVVSWLGKGRS